MFNLAQILKLDNRDHPVIPDHEGHLEKTVLMAETVVLVTEGRKEIMVQGVTMAWEDPQVNQEFQGDKEYPDSLDQMVFKESEVHGDSQALWVHEWVILLFLLNEFSSMDSIWSNIF